MDITGLTVALGGPLASACITAYGLLKNINSIDEHTAAFQSQVEIQLQFLSVWVETWVEFESEVDDPSMPRFPRPGKLRGEISEIGHTRFLLALRILAKITKIIADTRTLQTAYGIEVEPIPIPVVEGNAVASSSGSITIQTSSLSTYSPTSLRKSGSPEVVSMSLTSTPPSPAPISSAQPKNSAHALRSWLRRAGCHRLCSRERKEEGPIPRKAVTNIPAAGLRKSPKGKGPADLPSGSAGLHLETQVLDIGDNEAAVEAAKRDIVDKLTKIQCLRWVLSDKDKGMALVCELEQWNRRLREALPLERLENPGRIRAGKHNTAPYYSSPIFTGRDAALKFLERVFFSKELQRRQRRAVLHGLGGAGKTQIALKFAEEHSDKFDSIFWVDASSDYAVEESYRDIAELLKVSGCNLVRAVKHHLASPSNYSNYSNYLMIFDNADDLPALATYFPSGKHGNILVTSRDPKTMSLTEKNDQTFEVDQMSQTDACDLLRRASRLSPEEFEVPETKEIAGQIVEKLGYLPLAIDQAGAYIANTCRIGDYLRIYDTIRPQLMNNRGFRGSGYAASVYQTWELSLAAVKDKNPAAAELMMVLGYFHYEGIPEKIFESGSAAFSRASRVTKATGRAQLSPLGKLLAETRCDPTLGANDPTGPCDPPLSINDPTGPPTGGNSESATWAYGRFDQAMETLRGYSLIKRHLGRDRHPPTYTVHPLVHCWIRDRCGQEPMEQQRAQDTAIALLQETMLANEKGGYAPRHHLVIQLEAWVRPYLDNENVTIDGHTEEERIGVLEAAGLTYHDVGRLADAELLREKILQWRILNLGKRDPHTCRARADLAMTYRAAGKFQKAMLLDEETVCIFSESDMKGPDHPDTLQAKLNLAWTYSDVGNNIAKAERLEREVIAKRSDIYGPESLQVGVARGSLGMSLWRQARYKEAEEEFAFALKKKVAGYGKEHPSTLLTMGNLASALRGQKRWASAENLNREVLDIRERTLGPDKKHKDIARAMANLGVTLLEAGRVEEAYEWEMKALDMFRETVGEYHLHTIDTLENLGRVLPALGKDVEAIETLEQLVSKQKIVRGEAHPVTLEAMKLLGEFAGHEDMLNKAREIEQKETERKEKEAENNLKGVGDIEDKMVRSASEAGPEAASSSCVGGEELRICELQVEARKKRHEELVELGMLPDRWNILATL